MKKIALLSLSIMFLASANAQAMFDTPFWGVRAMGMGGAFTAVSDDANAAAYNVAGIAGVEKPEVTAMSARLFYVEDGMDMSAQYINAVYPISEKIGSFALGWFHFGDTGLASEDTVNLGYAHNVVKLSWLKLMLGANVKYLRQAVDDTVNLSNNAMAVDVGVLARFKYGISVGYSGKYLNKPDIGLLEKDEVLMTNTVGLAYYSEELALLKIPHFTLAADYEMRDSQNTLLLGMESRVFDKKLALRAGGWAEQLNFGLGYKFEFKDKSALYIDYAFGLPLKVQETYGSHFFSLSYRFK